MRGVRFVVVGALLAGLLVARLAAQQPVTRGIATADSVGNGWHAATHVLGRGRMRADQVTRVGAGVRLGLVPGTCDGAEVRSEFAVLFGVYAVRMRVPRAPGSLSAFFLYGNTPGDNDEIDIELYDDGSRRAILTAWIGGRETRSAPLLLPFDPAGEFHDYEIRWSPFALQFRADGITLARWTDGYPTRPMHLMANVWWPIWMECTPPDRSRALVIEALPIVPNPRPR